MNLSCTGILRFWLISLPAIIAQIEAKLVNGTSTFNNTGVDNRATNFVNRFMKTDFKQIGLRAVYVIGAVSTVVLAYVFVRAICSRRRKNRTRRYGMLSNESRDHMEMRPLSEHEDDDDDDDMTLFDISRRKGKR
eukprot:gene15792-17385_t